MPQRKRTRTTSGELLPSRSERKMRHLRHQIAAEAARIMATEGQRNYRLAKQKAAFRIGINSRLALPSNKEVELELRQYQECYGGEKHDRHLETLRSSALKVMRALEQYRPRLVGPVLEGTADQHSRVSLHLFYDPPDIIPIELTERGITFSVESRNIRWHDGSHRSITVLVTDVDDSVVELALFSNMDLRQSPPSPIDGRPQKRAPVNAVECLLAGV